MVNLHSLIDSLNKNNVFTVYADVSTKTVKNQAPDVSSWLLSNAKDAVCFDLGYAGNKLDLKIIPELFKIPYEVCWFEFQNSNGIACVLVVQCGEDLFHCAVFNKRQNFNVWFLINVIEVFYENEELLMKEIVSFDKTLKAFEYSAALVTILAEHLMAMNCSNVIPKEHKAPEYLNLKRISKKKQPLFSYWTLHISNESNEEKESLGGTHSSPRLHLRRGHIRQYAKGKYTWVQACLVGDKQKGLVTKDYSFRVENHSSAIN